MWSGTVSFGLVTIPVKLYNAVSRKNVSFNQLDDRTMSRIKLRKVSPETGEEVPEEHIIRGYEIEKGRFVQVDPDELEALLPTSTRAIEIDDFVDLASIDPLYFDSPYHLAPDKAPKPYALLAKAMEATGKVGIATMVMRNKQYLAAIRARDGVLELSTMVWADEVVTPESIDELAGVREIEVSERELAMAQQLVESLAGEFDPERYRDTYREQLLDLINRKAEGEEIVRPVAAASTPAVVDLMAALEASVQAAKAARARHPAVAKTA
jgi:DNA end-binding protein Ku